MANFGPLSRFARGLYGLLDLKSDGIGPSGFMDSVQPIVEMFPYLAADATRTVALTWATAPGVSETRELRPPTGTTWLVRSLSLVVSTPGAVDRLSMQTGVQAPLGSVPGGGDVRVVLAQVNNTGVFGNVALPAALTSCSHTFAQPYVIQGGGPSGAVSTNLPGLFAAAQIGTSNAIGTVIFTALVHEVPS